MTRQEKDQLVKELTQEFADAQGIAVCDYKGLTVSQLEAVRKSAREQDLQVKVVKNTIASIALGAANKEGLELKDTNIFIWGSDQVSLAKTITKVAKDEEKFVIKFGHFDGAVVEKSQIEAISKLPSREELVGMLLSVWTAPMRNMAYVLNAPLSNFATALNNLAQKEQ